MALCVVVGVALTARCSRTLSGRYGWDASEHFPGAAEQRLCWAIQRSDEAAVRKALDAGADPTAIGKSGVTPLLWAWAQPSDGVFRQLLESGADPNVMIQSDLGVPKWGPGQAVTHLCCLGDNPERFDLVFAHGGDPDLVYKVRRRLHTSLLLVIELCQGEERQRRVGELIRLGADLNVNENDTWTSGRTPLSLAVSEGAYDVAAQLVEAGANLRAKRPGTPFRIIHLIHIMGDARKTADEEQQYKRLIELFEERGESLADAAAERAYWSTTEGRQSLSYYRDGLSD